MVVSNRRIVTYVILILVLLGLGTLVYSLLEGWGFVDSLYFSTTTLTTIGYGDIHPTRDSTKLFTVFYVLVGVALILSALSTINVYYLEKSRKQINRTISRVTEGLKKKPTKWVRLGYKKK